ncbi:MAG: AmmeMemoRadiSam system protein B [Candidatus Kapaibacteriales bacterium]
MTQDAPEERMISYRPPTVAGSFYPIDPDSLNSMIEEFLQPQQPKMILNDFKILGIVSPHAGYIYSGFVAGKVYREIIGRDYKTVIIISPSHYVHFPFASVFDGDAYVTPFNSINVDKELSKEIATRNPLVRLSKEGHSWQKVTPEHSLEVQIPFIQKVLPNAKIVPIVMGEQDFQTIHALTTAIVFAVKKLNLSNHVLFIASSDLSHYHSYETAQNIDVKFINTFNSFDYFKLSSLAQNNELEACGAGPIAVVMQVCEALGANKAQTLFYATSGDSPFARAPKDRVVGYFAGALLKIPDYVPKELPELSDKEKQELKVLVANSIESAVTGIKKPIVEYSTLPSSFNSQFTGFVTIEKNGELRACMGHTFATKPLFLELQDVARSSATSDWRFGKITPDELPFLTYEITILSRFRKVFDFSQIEIGKHGLYVRYKNQSGLLLPQVALDHNWDVTTFLEHLCIKAGLPKRTYLDPLAEIFCFDALIIY